MTACAEPAVPAPFAESGRVRLVPLCARYLNDYRLGFDEEAARYQMSDGFPHVSDAAEYFRRLHEEETIGLSLCGILTDPEGAFLGGIEAHGLWGDTPSLGIWLSANARGKGFGREALSLLLGVLKQKGFRRFRYETDRRNAASVRLAESLGGVTDGAVAPVTSRSGKRLELVSYLIVPQ